MGGDVEVISYTWLVILFRPSGRLEFHANKRFRAVIPNQNVLLYLISSYKVSGSFGYKVCCLCVECFAKQKAQMNEWEVDLFKEKCREIITALYFCLNNIVLGSYLRILKN